MASESILRKRSGAPETDRAGSEAPAKRGFEKAADSAVFTPKSRSASPLAAANGKTAGGGAYNAQTGTNGDNGLNGLLRDFKMGTSGPGDLKNGSSGTSHNKNTSSKAGDPEKGPPSSERTPSVLKSFFLLVSNMTRTSAPLPNTVVSLLSFYFNHAMLLFIFFVISIYKNVQFLYRRIALKLLTLAYYPNNTPQLIRADVNKLAKIPKRLAAILDLRDDDVENGGIDGLISDISELVAWSLSTGIPSLTVYEYNGAVVPHLTELRRYIDKHLSTYFGTDSVPVYSLRVPHSNKMVFSGPLQAPERVDLEITLLSQIDGKPTILELTRTMSELAVNKELAISDISVDLIDEELVELVGCEPDLLVSFGPALDLQDYPPWHIRLSEIYWEPDNMNVNYAVFIRALQKFSNCKVNVGK